MEKVTPDIYRLQMPPSAIPGLESSNVYFAGKDEIVLIDAGYPTQESIDIILTSWRELGCPVIKAILITHAHIDHIGAINAIKRETGAPVLAHRLETEPFKEMFPMEQLDIIPDEGDEIDVNEIKLRVLHMPGHTAGHLCFFDESSGALFTGDTVIGNDYAVIVPPNGDMSDYMNSLNRIKTLSPRIILPGHGPVINDPKNRIDEYIVHRNLREIQILMLLEAGPKSIPDLSEEIYADLLPGLRIAGRLQIYAHLTKLAKEGHAEHVSDEGTDGIYRSLVGKVSS